ncbi:MAG: c-type cytochrome [Cardiobacteriaceae bacterium]|nr:c-type cytochrome [Cardiobacteriaceae bacterium]
MAANTQIPGYAKTLMAVAAVFMPVFLILPFFFWGNENNQINLAEQDIQAGRLAPVGRLNLVSSEPAVAEGGADAAAFDAEATYKNVCAACHATGVLNAPKLGDTAQWQAKLDERGGIDGLIKQGIQGLNAMPPKGGATVSDEEFGKVVKYMLKNSSIAVEGESDAPAAEAAPAESAPATEAPAETAPAEQAPAAEATSESAPAAEATSESAPVAEATAESAPATEAPAESAPAAETPAPPATEEVPAKSEEGTSAS